MTLSDLTDRAAVQKAITEFDRLGRERFLEHYGFGRSRSYVLRYGDHDYDSKAIAGVAHGYQFPDRGPLLASEFSGGEQTVSRVLGRLGFEVRRQRDIDEGLERAGQRNPTWAMDELVLALDLYLTSGQLDDSDRRVIELSEVLNRLPIHTVRPDLDKFRNPNGVALKLANFAALDPAYPGVGMTRGGRRDAEAWNRYHDNREELHKLATWLRAEAAAGSSLVTPEEGEEEVDEGRLSYRLHRTRERDRSLVQRKKTAARAAGTLACEVCGFDFELSYGSLGRDFIECHHVRPLSLSGQTKTKSSDLVLVCANCHRMAHRGRPWPTLDQLIAVVNEHR